MKRFRFKKIDAFTGERSPGNPAGCVYLDGMTISEEEMLEIARQLKGFVCEVAYVLEDGEGLSLRYYSSEREVEFCGHATVATMFDYFTQTPERRALPGITIRAGGQALPVMSEVARGGGVFIAAPEPRFLPFDVSPGDVARAMRIDVSDIDGRYPLMLVNAGLNSLLVPMRVASKLTDALPVLEELHDFCTARGVDIVVPFTDDRILPGSHYRTRVFAPRFGYLEDPATGSGNAALGAMLLREGFWKGGELTIEQGRSYRAPNIVKLRPKGDGGVLFGGAATVRIDGYYCLS